MKPVPTTKLVARPVPVARPALRPAAVRDPAIRLVVAHGGRTAIVIKRDALTTEYLNLNPEGLRVESSDSARFDSRHKPETYDVVRAAKKYLDFATRHGATGAALEALVRVITPRMTREDEEHVMAARKKQAEKNEKIQKSVDRKPKVKAEAGANGEKKSRAPRAPRASAASLFRELIMRGTLSDDQIFERVQEKFGLEEKSRKHVAWYRNKLKNSGMNPPPKKIVKKVA